MFRRIAEIFRPSIPAAPDHPRPFGPNIDWLDVCSDDPLRVLARVRALDPRVAAKKEAPCNWEHGRAAAYRSTRPHGLYFTPPQAGHVLVAGYAFRKYESEEIERILVGLNEDFPGRTCYFATQRNISAVAWAVAESGALKRAYVSSDYNIHLRFGEPLPQEADADFHYLEEVKSSEDEDISPVGEADILRLAGLLAVDPSRFGKPPFVEPSVGILAF